MSKEKHKIDLHHAPRYILAGALILTPLLVTWLVFEFLFHTLFHLGNPACRPLTRPFIASPPGLRNGCLPPGWNT
jgi:uncharacterized membrane protein